MAADPHITRVWREAAIGAAGAAVFLAVPFLLKQVSDPPVGFRILSLTVCMAAAVVWAFTFAARAFAHADEFLRERDKTAWFWGGLSGVAVSAPIYAFVMMGGLHWLDPTHPISPELGRAFAMGYGLPIFCQLAGYFVIHAWWRVSKR